MRPLELELEEISKKATAILTREGKHDPVVLLFTEQGTYPYPLHYTTNEERDQALRVVKSAVSLLKASRVVFVTQAFAAQVPSLGTEIVNSECLIIIGEEVGKSLAVLQLYTKVEGQVVLGKKGATESFEDPIFEGMLADFN